MSSTYLDMAPDVEYHSESEFYYADQTGHYNEKENIISGYRTKTIKVLNSQCNAKVYFNTTNGKHSEENRVRLKRLEKIIS